MLSALFSFCAPSFPQTPAESAAQETLRQQERERLLRQRQEGRPDVRLDPGDLLRPGGPSTHPARAEAADGKASGWLARLAGTIKKWGGC